MLRCITAADDYTADIFIEGETISAIGKNLTLQADTIIDASGKLVFPGGIDPHVHLDMPFMGTFSSDSYETGTRAALYGGTTMVIDFILQTQGKSLQHALTDWRSRSDNNCVGDYSFHMAVTDFNEQTKKEIKKDKQTTIADIIKLERLLASPVLSFRIKTTKKGGLNVAFKQVKQYGEFQAPN